MQAGAVYDMEERRIPLSAVVLGAVAVVSVSAALVSMNATESSLAGGAIAAATLFLLLVTGGFLYWLVRQLEESEWRLSTIVESAADGILVTDERGIVESFNTAAVAMFGYRPGEIIGNHFVTLLPAKCQSWKYEEGDVFADLLLRNGLPETGGMASLDGLRRDGSSFHMDLSVSSTVLDSRIVYTLVLRDVTERVAAQTALREARDRLEVRVAERTTDLQQANQKLRSEIEERMRAQVEREKSIRELQDALSQIKTLKGLLPICAACKKIRDDKGYWNQIEVFIRDHSEAEFSHSICPECMTKLYPELTESQ